MLLPYPKRPSFTLSVVVPVYNEDEVILEFHQRVTAVLQSLQQPYTILYVDDGSDDQTVPLIQSLISDLPNHNGRGDIKLIQLSRNFGKEIALTAGLDHADSDATVIIDSDLQDPPELIPKLIERWLEGYDVVYATRAQRDGESRFKKLTAYLFYRLLRKISRIDIPEDTGDFRLLGRAALDALKRLRERNRYMKGLYAWVGFSQTSVLYNRDPRFAGTTKWNYFKLWNLALEGITSFTTKPLKVASYIGFLTAMGAFLFGTWIILQKLLLGNPVDGYPSLMTVILFMGGIQLMTLGIIGEYLARTFSETKGRPIYIVKELHQHEQSKSVGDYRYGT